MQGFRIPIDLRFAYPLFIILLGSISALADSPDIPTPEILSKELGISLKELPKVTEDFATAITQGQKSKSYGRLCARGEIICSALSDFYAQDENAKKERAARRRKVRPFRVNEKNFIQAQTMNFSSLVQAVKINNEHQFIELAEKSLKFVDCPRNLSSALSIRAEEFFPSPAPRAYAKQLFLHASQCLQKSDDAYERLHLRQGLYEYYEGNKKKAKDLLLIAKEATHTKEKYRSLYWLGQIAHDEGVKPAKNSAWQDLLNEFPMSFYAIDASLAMKQDPMTVITNHRVGAYKRAVEDNDELNNEIRWLEALFIYKKFNSVAKWSSWIVRNNEDLEVDVLNYLSTIKIASGLYRSNINMLFSYFKKNPKTLNEEALRLLYPRPFFQLVQNASKGKIDSFLVLALMRQESAFDSKAISRANAKGLMQIIPGTARRLASGGHRKLLNVKSNTEMGVKYLMNLAERFNGRMELVLAAYNAGPVRVDEWLKRNPNRSELLLWNDLIPYMETRDYVVSILRNNYFYYRLYGDGEKQESPFTNENIYSSEIIGKLLTAKKD